MTNQIHIGWLIGSCVSLGICLAFLGVSAKLNREFLGRQIENETHLLWSDKRFHLLGKLFKSYLLLSRESKVFIPDCYLVQSEDYDFLCQDVKDGIDVALAENKIEK